MAQWGRCEKAVAARDRSCFPSFRSYTAKGKSLQNVQELTGCTRMPSLASKMYSKSKNVLFTFILNHGPLKESQSVARFETCYSRYPAG